MKSRQSRRLRSRQKTAEGCSIHRSNIEDLKSRQEATVQKARATHEMEVQSLKVSITELREELENSKADKEEAVQKAEAKSQNEINQLKKSLGMLRERLDLQQNRNEDQIQKINCVRSWIPGCCSLSCLV